MHTKTAPRWSSRSAAKASEILTPRSTLVVLFALLTTATAVVFFAISIDRDIYAPGAGALHRVIRQHDRGLPRSEPTKFEREFGFRKIIRKLYSVVAFSIVGFCAAPLIRRKRRVLVDTLLIAGFSTLIELGQKVSSPGESVASNVFDIACGAFGGLLGAALWNLVLRMRRPAV